MMLLAAQFAFKCLSIVFAAVFTCQLVRAVQSGASKVGLATVAAPFVGPQAPGSQ